MKFLTLASVLALSTSAAFAASSINDLQYLPEAGVKYGTTQLNFKNDKEGTTRSSGIIVDQTIGYSVRDNLSVEVGIGYTEVKSKTAGVKSRTAGFSNPSVHAKYRLLDQGATRLDLRAGAHVNAFGDKTEKGENDSANEGGSAFDLGAVYGHKHDNFQWSFGATLMHKLESTTKDKVANTKEKHKAHNQVNLEANLLTSIYTNSFIKTSAGLEVDEPHKIKDNGNHAAENVYSVGVEYQYVMNKDLALSAGIKQLTNITNDEKQTELRYNVGAAYQF